VATQVTAVRGWLEEHFSAVGSGEYARMPLVRVFEDATAASEYRDGLAPMAGELVTNADGSKAFRQFPQWYSVVFTNDLGYANLSAMRLWFTDRDRDVFGSLPPWLLWGVSQLVGQAEAKGKRLGFSTSDMDRRGVGDSVSIAGLMKVPAADFEGSEVDRLADSLALVRFLCDGPGAKNKATRGIFPDYVRNLVAIVEEERAADEARKDTEPKTLQEQTDLERSRWDWVDERRDRFQAEAFERTFADWDAARWEKAEAAFQKSL
jgi:hypothetical protein